MFKKLLPIVSLALPVLASANDGIQSYVVYDFWNNRILESHNANQVKPIASVTKLMTANVFLENNKDKNCKASIQTIDSDFIKGTGTSLPMHTPIPCNELLKAMLVRSDNYAAHALSRSAGMTRAQFIQKMNQKARQLGMNSTSFEDSSGLSSGNVSSAMDLVKLAKYSLNKKVIRDLSNSPSVIVNTGRQNLYMQNTNALVRDENFTALINKTGYIREAGYNLVFVNRQKCGNAVIGVISLNNRSSGARTNFTRNKLAQYGCPSALS
ncbi:D-alanyl-D-alanine endopeptidase [Pasteurellaceae bacterium 15-036681]|nr:D-alanyl-D-alanine endopeptidase [Pasteurellaceae bacterium 15-036681]